MSGRISEIGRLVREFREGRQVPPDLRGSGNDDQALATITDGLDKLFAALDLGKFRGVPKPPPVRTTLMRVIARSVLCHNEEVVALTFGTGTETVLAGWTPGSHVDVTLPSGLVRQYSLCGDPRETDSYTVAVRLIPDGRGGSAEMHTLRVGDPVSITGPRNGFFFVDHRRMVFVAGGVGITAILPMVRRARTSGMDWHLVYCGRDQDSMPFLDEVGIWEPDRVRIRTDAEHGLPGAATLLQDVEPGDAVYCCGPPPMIEAVRAGLPSTGATHFHYERFSPPPVVGGAPFEVRLARTGATVAVAADQSALAAIRAVLPHVPYSCSQGFCGTCRAQVLDDPDRSDMLICVDRTEGDPVVLDL